MATIGSLAVNIVATTDKFVAGLNTAQTKLGRFVSKISAAQTAVIGLGVYGFGRMISAALEAGSELHDLSQKLGITTEALSALDYATKQLGGTTQGMHNALAIMARTLGDAASGAKAAQQAFTQLGLNFADLITQSPDQQFLKIVDAINKLPTAAEKASAAQNIFGRGAKDLSAVINAGTAEIIKMGDEAARTGAIIGTDQAAALDTAADAATAFKDSWSALWIQSVAVFAPLITGAMKVIEVGLLAVRAVWKSLQVFVTTGLEVILAGLEQVASALNVVLPKFAEFDVGGITAEREALGELRRKQLAQLDVIGGAKGDNPLLKELVEVTKANQGTVQLATAGVR